MRVCIVGTGLSGCLLAWRLRAADAHARIDLVGTGRAADATAVSGGLTRGFEVDADGCASAAASLAELRDSAVLRAWAGYREVGSTYVTGADPATVADRLATVDAALPGSAEAVATAQLLAGGSWAALPHAMAVVERHAGFVSPRTLRDAVLADVVGERVRLVDAGVDRVGARPDGSATASVAGAARAYDAVVVAVGRWTATLLDRSGFAPAGYRVKAIQYATHAAAGELPMAFVDDTSGLYGRPSGDGEVLLGLPTDAYGADPYGADPDRPRGDAELVDRAVAVAAERLPRLVVGAVRQVVVAADCYTEPAGLALRAVVAGARLYTLTGGSGGAAKTALAATRAAAGALLDGLPTAGTDSARLAGALATTSTGPPRPRAPARERRGDATARGRQLPAVSSHRKGTR